AALLLPAIQGALRRTQLVKEGDDLRGLSTALEDFKAKYGIYPPSRIRLRENTKYDPNDPFDAHSVKYLKQIWPSLIFPNANQCILWCKDSPLKTEKTLVFDSTAG